MTPGPGIFRTKLPKGFTAAGINCGVRRYRPDLGLIVSEVPATTAGVFTTNLFAGSPVTYCKTLLPSSSILAIITNSGQANAGTGEQGDLDNLAMVTALADTLTCDSNQILTASTGVIGDRIELDKILPAIPILSKQLTNIAEPFANAILTTDLVPKTVYKDLTLSQGNITLTGVCKGSGMIHPNMATMLGYFLTDLQLSPEEAQAYLTQSTNKSFNMISVDGETSTNDSVFLMANGQSKVSLANDEDRALFQAALDELSILLAQSIARDGEGATKLIEIKVSGLASENTAKDIAKSMIQSPLIKTAINGESPNWGRIVSRLGLNSLTTTEIASTCIQVQGITMIKNGHPIAVDLKALRTKMKEDTIAITLSFTGGTQEATAWGCDLSTKYCQINAEYVS